MVSPGSRDGSGCSCSKGCPRCCSARPPSGTSPTARRTPRGCPRRAAAGSPAGCGSGRPATAALSLSAIGFTSALGPFWTLPTMFLSGTAAAGGIALINSLGNVAGFAGPYLVGLVKDATDGYAGALLAFALLMLAGAALAL